MGREGEGNWGGGDITGWARDCPTWMHYCRALDAPTLSTHPTLRFCRYFDVEERYVYAEEGRYCATAELLEPLIDENTIGGWALWNLGLGLGVRRLEPPAASRTDCACMGVHAATAPETQRECRCPLPFIPPGVAAVLGTTFTGEFEDVQAIDAMVGEWQGGAGQVLAVLCGGQW